MDPLYFHLSAAAAETLLSALWESLVLVTAVALCLRLVPRIGASSRSVIWTAVLLIVSALPFLPRTTHPGTLLASAPVHANPLWSVALATLWATFTLFRAAQLLRSAWHLRGIARRSRAVETTPSIAALLTETRRPATLRTSTEVDRPSVVGFFTPAILLPPDLLARLTAPELEQIVLHEREHLLRRDDWTNLLQKLALTLFPLNPALLWVERRLCLERELACDDGVLRATHAPKAYATCLTSLAEHSLLRRGLSLALGAWERRPELARRVHRILRQPQREFTPRQSALALTVLLSALTTGAVALSHTPQLVSFQPEAPTLAQLQPEPAVYPEQTTAHAILAKAIMPQRPTAPALKPPTPHRVLAVQHRAARNAPANSWVVLTSYTQVVTDDGEQGTVTRATYLVAPAATQPAPRPSYAAVPTRNGWMIVQL
jgi:beta-lactamase regulating signal transducer with metallopeptidase domain